METVRRIFSAFLIIAVILTSSGISFGRMQCLESGAIKYSLGVAKDCCPEKSTAPSEVIKSKCCDLKTAEVKLSDYSQAELKYTLPPALPFKSFIIHLPEAEEEKNIFFDRQGPLITGRIILCQISLLLI